MAPDESAIKKCRKRKRSREHCGDPPVEGCQASSNGIIESSAQYSIIDPERGIAQIKECGLDLSRIQTVVKNITESWTASIPESLSIQEKATWLGPYEECYLIALRICYELVSKLSRKKIKSSTKKQTKSIAEVSTSCERFDEQIGEIVRVASSILNQYPTESCRIKCMHIYGKAGLCKHAADLLFSKHDSDFLILRNDIEIIKLLQAALAACVPWGEWEIALDTLTKSTIVFSSLRNTITTQSCNIVLNAMCAAKEGIAASNLVHDMMEQNMVNQNDCSCCWPRPDQHSFLYVMNGLINFGWTLKTAADSLVQFDAAYRFLNEMIRCRTLYNDDSLYPSYPHFDLLIRTYSRHGHKQMACYIANELRNNTELTICPDPILIRKKIINVANESVSSSSSLTCHDNMSQIGCADTVSSTPLSFALWDGDTSKNGAFVKHGRGRVAYWAYATYKDTDRDFTIALQPHREPSKNGIKILLYDNKLIDSSCTVATKWNSSTSNVDNKNKAFSLKKSGFVLLFNSHIEKSDANDTTNVNQLGKSCLLGMYLDPLYRKSKLSKVLLAIWLDLCVKASLIPETGVINKPLLSLVLQNTYKFRPFGTGGFDVEIVSHPPLLKNNIASSCEMQNEHNQDDNNHLDDSNVNSCNYDTIHLYCPTESKSLIGGAFAAMDLKRENIQIVQEEPQCRGRIFRLCCSLRYNYCDTDASGQEHLRLVEVAKTKLCAIVNLELTGVNRTGKIVYYNSNENTSQYWAKIMLGTST